MRVFLDVTAIELCEAEMERQATYYVLHIYKIVFIVMIQVDEAHCKMEKYV